MKNHQNLSQAGSLQNEKETILRNCLKAKKAKENIFHKYLNAGAAE